MEDLAAAAAMASQERDSGDAQQPAKEPESVSGKKRGRGTKIEAAEKKLLELVSKRAIAAAKVEQLQALESKKKRDEEAIKSAKNKCAGFDAAIAAARDGVEQLKAAAAAVASSKAAKAAAAAAKEEATKALSEAGAIRLCELRGKYSKQIDNSSDKVDAVWAHIHRDFMKDVEKGDLPTSDGRSAAALS